MLWSLTGASAVEGEFITFRLLFSIREPSNASPLFYSPREKLSYFSV